jgi:hypothetical protein
VHLPATANNSVSDAIQLLMPAAGTLVGSSESVRVATVEQDDAKRGKLHKQLVAEAIIRGLPNSWKSVFLIINSADSLLVQEHLRLSDEP